MIRTASLLALYLSIAASARAADRFVVIVSGASGEPQYVEQYAGWCETLDRTLTGTMAIDPAHVNVLTEHGAGVHAATAVNVRRTLGALRGKMRSGDVALIVLIGHGTFDGVDGKFNLVGPDLTSRQWADLIKPLPGRVVVVDTTAASFPFLQAMSGPGRIVITATDSGAQRFDTVFPEYFVRALGDEGADLDKNGRVSIWEAFLSASLGVRRHYQQRGRLATERPLLDDNGDGQGREADGEGTDGADASRMYFDAEPAAAPPTDGRLIMLLQKRAALQLDADDLRRRKVLMTPDAYAQEFERLMIDLARTEHEIRRRQEVGG